MLDVPAQPSKDEVHRREIAPDELVVAYRLVTTDDRDDPALVDSFKSNRALNKQPRGRERRQPEIHSGISVYKTVAQAADMRRRIAASLPSGVTRRMGPFAARLALRGPGVMYEDRDEVNGHMTIWAQPSRCMELLVDIERLAD